MLKRILVVAALALGCAACDPEEGDRCNPMLFVDDCANNTVCTVPPNCVVAFCCPKSGASTNANCQACPAGDAGTTD